MYYLIIKIICYWSLINLINGNEAVEECLQTTVLVVCEIQKVKAKVLFFTVFNSKSKPQ